MSPPHVLVVDDSELVTQALAVLLDATGHRATTASSVATALDAARQDAPDVLLVDLSLPDGDGLGVLAALRAEGRAPRVAVALTGHDDPETEARCLSAGCRAVLVKPVRSAALIAGLREWLAE